MQNNPDGNPRKDFEPFRERYIDMLLHINGQKKLGMTEAVISKNVKFAEACYHYVGSIHGLETYLKGRSYMLHSNFGDSKLFLQEFEKELENIRSGDFLIGYYTQ